MMPFHMDSPRGILSFLLAFHFIHSFSFCSVAFSFNFFFFSRIAGVLWRLCRCLYSKRVWWKWDGESGGTHNSYMVTWDIESRHRHFALSNVSRKLWNILRCAAALKWQITIALLTGNFITFFWRRKLSCIGKNFFYSNLYGFFGKSRGNIYTTGRRRHNFTSHFASMENHFSLAGPTDVGHPFYVNRRSSMHPLYLCTQYSSPNYPEERVR